MFWRLTTVVSLSACSACGAVSDNGNQPTHQERIADAWASELPFVEAASAASAEFAVETFFDACVMNARDDQGTKRAFDARGFDIVRIESEIGVGDFRKVSTTYRTPEIDHQRVFFGITSHTDISPSTFWVCEVSLDLSNPEALTSELIVQMAPQAWQLAEPKSDKSGRLVSPANLGGGSYSIRLPSLELHDTPERANHGGCGDLDACKSWSMAKLSFSVLPETGGSAP